MKLYNTLTQEMDPVTSDDGIFRMYVCGVTPYDTTHLGHAFTYISFDVLARYLEFLGYETIIVQNVTDIDDDILDRAKELGISWDELAERETQKYLEDMDALNVRRPDHFPYATQEIPMIVEIVSNLLEKGHAYEKNGSVYYDIRQDHRFGRYLVEMGYDEMLKTANERGNHPDDPNKRDPLDFVLWQTAQPGEPTWDSPWGKGRPGWHIECSAMSMRYLGPTLDVHCGGSDLIFPHHSCEIAQSEQYSGERPFVRYWFHVAMVRMGGEKMSKSLGNMVFVRDLRERYSPEAIRLYILSHHYRDPWSADNTEEGVQGAEETLARWREALTAMSGSSLTLDSTRYEASFREAMDTDLDTPRAIWVLEKLANDITLDQNRGRSVEAAQSTLQKLASVLGLKLDATS